MQRRTYFTTSQEYPTLLAIEYIRASNTARKHLAHALSSQPLLPLIVAAKCSTPLRSNLNILERIGKIRTACCQQNVNCRGDFVLAAQSGHECPRCNLSTAHPLFVNSAVTPVASDAASEIRSSDVSGDTIARYSPMPGCWLSKLCESSLRQQCVSRHMHPAFTKHLALE